MSLLIIVFIGCLYFCWCKSTIFLSSAQTTNISYLSVRGYSVCTPPYQQLLRLETLFSQVVCQYGYPPSYIYEIFGAERQDTVFQILAT